MGKNKVNIDSIDSSGVAKVESNEFYKVFKICGMREEKVREILDDLLDLTQMLQKYNLFPQQIAYDDKLQPTMTFNGHAYPYP